MSIVYHHDNGRPLGGLVLLHRRRSPYDSQPSGT
jgi:hypothetical protein